MTIEPNAPAMTQDQVLLEWQKARDELLRAANVEMTMRRAVIATFFPTAAPDEEGTRNYELGNEWKLKAVFKLNYNVDKKNVDTMLDTLEKTGDDGKFIAERIINWSPSLSVKEYRELSDEQKKIVDTVITIKPGTPSLEIVEPK